MRGERGSHERAGARDGGEMMAKQNPFVCRDEVAAVVVALAGCGARVIKRENFGGDEGGIEPIRHQITAGSSNNEPGSV